MLILVISTNPLYREIIHETLPKSMQCNVLDCDPHQALSSIREQKPDVILIDETIATANLEKILAEVRKLDNTRTIVTNLQQNEIILVDSRRAIIRKIGDLMEAIMKKTVEEDMEEGDCDVLEMSEAAKNLSGVYGFLAAMFNQRPDRELVRRMRSIGVSAFVNLGDGQDNSGDIASGIQQIADYIERTADLPEEQVEQELAVDWTRLFRGVSPNYGPPPPYEGTYSREWKDEIALFQALAEEYGQGGVEISDDYHNRLDYMGLELGYMSYLAEQEANAWEGGDAEQAGSYAERARQFYQQHLMKWPEKFFTVALEHARTGFFKGFLLLARGCVTQMSEQVVHL